MEDGKTTGRRYWLFGIFLKSLVAWKRVITVQGLGLGTLLSRFTVSFTVTVTVTASIGFPTSHTLAYQFEA